MQLLVRESGSDHASALVRKLATYCLCLLMTSGHFLGADLVEAIATHLYAFEQMSFGAGKILLNTKLPTDLLSALNKNPGLLKTI